MFNPYIIAKCCICDTDLYENEQVYSDDDGNHFCDDPDCIEGYVRKVLELKPAPLPTAAEIRGEEMYTQMREEAV